MTRLPLTAAAAFFAFVPAARVSAADDPTAFFENKVRPVLVEHCYACHSADAEAKGKLKGGLRLDTRQATRAGGDSGPAVVPGDAKAGTFLKSVRYDGDVQMPPKGKLPAAVVADLEKWVAMGAPDPRDGETKSAGGIDLAKGREFWAFRPPVKVTPPVVSGAATDIDRFVLAKLTEQKLTPVGPADKRTLLRRAYLDLWGLPPTPEEVDAFLADRSPDAFDRVIDKLLAGPHYGERWARHWLDVARYAEDQAHTFAVKPKTGAYQYRDWVIKAFNADMPFDRFARLQIAGDLTPDDAGDRFTRLAGLGFVGLGAEYYKNTAAAQAIADELDDRVDTLTRGFLALTVSCARCHDHKFDPVPTRDYYSLAGVFFGFKPAEVPLVPPEVVAAYDAGQKRVKEQDDKIAALQNAASKAVADASLPRTADYLLAARQVAEAKRLNKPIDPPTVAEKAGLDRYLLGRWGTFLTSRRASELPAFKPWQALTDKSSKADVTAAAETAAKAVAEAAAAKAKGGAAAKAAEPLLKALYSENNSPFNIPPAESEKRYLSDAQKKELADLRAELDRRKAAAPTMYPVAHVIAGGGAGMPVYVRGNPAKPGEAAPKGFLQVLSADGAKAGKDFTRLDLANAVADPRNPLTARVIVNRVWEKHFGRGIVGTPSNFGSLGDRPTHPELLDYLTARFVENGLSLKWLHREILRSAAYQRAGTEHTTGLTADPDNKYLWRFPRRRLDVEAWRDTVLAVAGTLDRGMFGPTFDLKNAGVTRRTVYAKVSRHELDGLLRLFDFPDANVTADRRTVTTVPQQQLFSLNSEFMAAQARAFAVRVEKAAATDADRVTAAYRLAYGRPPSADELVLGTAFVARPADKADKLTPWQQYAQVLLAANELLYVD